MSIQVDSCHWSGVSREQWCWVARSRSVGHGAFVQRTLDFLVMHPSRQQSDCIHRQYDSDGKELACDAGSWSSTLGLGRSPGEGNGNPPQYSCLENPTDRGALWATVQGVTKSQTWLSDWRTRMPSESKFARLCGKAGTQTDKYQVKGKGSCPKGELPKHIIMQHFLIASARIQKRVF